MVRVDSLVCRPGTLKHFGLFFVCRFDPLSVGSANRQGRPGIGELVVRDGIHHISAAKKAPIPEKAFASEAPYTGISKGRIPV